MIRYALKCEDDHEFDAWFASGGAYDALRRGGKVTCPHCGSSTVDKALMAPGVASRDDLRPTVSTPETPLAKLKAFVESKAEYVGNDFATRARAMHEGTETHRPIYGQAALPDARKLVEDGVSIAPIPFIPKSKTH